MTDFSNYINSTELLTKAQDVETDNREMSRESHNFIDKSDGQWEPEVISTHSNRPRYTFDKTTPLIDQISGEIDQADFDIRIRPAGGEATKETAMLYDGLIRNIESLSNAPRIYSQAGRENVVGGIAGWLVKQDWADGDSFDQDLLIVPINNFEDRVFFDVGAEMEDMSDANYVFVLTSMAKADYDEAFPEGSGMSVNESNIDNVYTYKKDSVVVAQMYYKKPIKRELVKFSDGSVREATDDLDQAMDELAKAGIVEEGRRERETMQVFTRLFDGGDWLNEEQETVFTDRLPVIPVFGNFHIREGKVIYHGAVRNMMDPQRVYNYTRSRETEEVALSPRAKIWMTRTQAQGESATLRTLNTNADPVQFYTPDKEAPGVPQQSGGAVQNPGLLTASQNAARDLTEAAGLFGLNQGRLDDGPMSGVAIQSLQNKGDNSTIKYFKSLEVAIVATAKVLVDAIPKVYDTNRQVRILREDGSQEMTSVNDRVLDDQTQQFLVVNDLSKGKYDVTCDVGPAFKNRQQESVKALMELGQAVPAVAEASADIVLKNIATPGVDLVAERLRQQMVMAGKIPESQLTEEEKQQIAAAQQQPQEPSPAEILAQAEVERVKAETADVISKAEDRRNQIQIDAAKATLAAEKQEHDQNMDELNLVLKQQSQAVSEQQASIQAMMEGQQADIENLKKQAETLKVLKDAMGVDTIVGPHNMEAYINQAKDITETQEGEGLHHDDERL